MRPQPVSTNTGATVGCQVILGSGGLLPLPCPNTDTAEPRRQPEHHAPTASVAPVAAKSSLSHFPRDCGLGEKGL